CGKNAHPIWNYFKPTSDKKFILCNLCPKTKYSTGTAVEYYGVRDEKKIKKLNGLLVRWIVCNQQPFCVVEDENLHMFVFELDPRYRLPSRQTISIHVWKLYERE
ncbi:1252_t:CDS:2, partial [Cetraspora pellucida]